MYPTWESLATLEPLSVVDTIDVEHVHVCLSKGTMQGHAESGLVSSLWATPTKFDTNHRWLRLKKNMVLRNNPSTSFGRKPFSGSSHGHPKMSNIFELRHLPAPSPLRICLGYGFPIL